MHEAVSDRRTVSKKATKRGKDKANTQKRDAGVEPHTRPEPTVPETGPELLIDVSIRSIHTPQPPPASYATADIGQIQPHNFAVVDHSAEPDAEHLERLLREEEDKQLERERQLHQQHMHHLQNQPAYVEGYDPYSGPPPATNAFRYGGLDSNGAYDYGELGGYDNYGYDDGGYGSADSYGAVGGHGDAGTYGSSAGYANDYVDHSQQQVYGQQTHVQPRDATAKHTVHVNMMDKFKYEHAEDAAHDDVYTKLLGFSSISLVYRGLALMSRYRELINRLDFAVFDVNNIMLKETTEAPIANMPDPVHIIQSLQFRVSRDDYDCENIE